MRNPYEVLDVSKTATAAEIQSAYRKLAKKLHPDLNPGDKTAEDRFKEVSGAYDLLGDEAKRKRFDNGEIDESGAERPPRGYYRDHADSDRGRAYSSHAGYDFMDEDDPFAEFFQRGQRGQRARPNRRGQDLHYRLTIAFVESITGAEKRLTLPDGGVLDVRIPPGLTDGRVLRLKGKGAPGAGTGGPGDALIEVEVAPDPRFVREGDDIIVETPISLTEAVLGGLIRVPTPDGAVNLTVPKGSNTGSKLRLKGKGAPRRSGGRGDQFVRLKIMLPRTPDPELEAFVKTWKPGADFNPREEASS